MTWPPGVTISEAERQEKFDLWWCYASKKNSIHHFPQDHIILTQTNIYSYYLWVVSYCITYCMILYDYYKYMNHEYVYIFIIECIHNINSGYQGLAGLYKT